MHHILKDQDIHTGIYKNPSDSLETAVNNTVLKMIRLIPTIKKSTKMLVISAGYGSSALHLAENHFCKIDLLAINEQAKGIMEKKIAKSEGADLITIATGPMEKLPYVRENFDIVWVQDLLMHSTDKFKVFREAARVLKPEGRFIFTDVMESDSCPPGALEEMLECVGLEDLDSTKMNIRLASRADLEQVYLKEFPDHLLRHQKNLLKELQTKSGKTSKKEEKKKLEDAIKKLGCWIKAGEQGFLNWGILQFQKRNV